MTYFGRIKNGVAVPDQSGTLPEGARVRIEVESTDPAFWDGKNVAQLAQEQGVKPVKDIAALGIHWPDDESIDDFLALVREVRR